MKLKDLLTNKRGQWAEQYAERHLVSQGLKLVQRNYACSRGEIDLIMLEQDILVFVEVRYRNSENYGGGLESIDFRKQKKLHTTANHYLQHHDQHADHPCRFDAIIMSGQAPKPAVNWLKNAF